MGLLLFVLYEHIFGVEAHDWRVLVVCVFLSAFMDVLSFTFDTIIPSASYVLESSVFTHYCNLVRNGVMHAFANSYYLHGVLSQPAWQSKFRQEWVDGQISAERKPRHTGLYATNVYCATGLLSSHLFFTFLPNGPVRTLLNQNVELAFEVLGFASSKLLLGSKAAHAASISIFAFFIGLVALCVFYVIGRGLGLRLHELYKSLQEKHKGLDMFFFLCALSFLVFLFMELLDIIFTFPRFSVASAFLSSRTGLEIYGPFVLQCALVSIFIVAFFVFLKQHEEQNGRNHECSSYGGFRRDTLTPDGTRPPQRDVTLSRLCSSPRAYSCVH